MMSVSITAERPDIPDAIALITELEALGEIKRMYVRPAYRGQGFAKRLLTHLTEYAQSHGVPLLRLETGIHQHEAIGLYERMGFHRIPPFGDYRIDPLSLCYEKSLTPPTQVG